MASEEQNIAAGEYVLGTLSEGERAAFTRDLQDTPDLRKAISRWRARLAPLADAVPAEAPPPGLWAAIEAAMRGQNPAAAKAETPGSRRAPGSANVVKLQRQVRFWRRSALAAGALAASLAIVSYVDRTNIPPPGVLDPGRYVAVVDSEGREPAMIVSVDTGAGTVSVRTLAAQVPDDKSLELWYIDDQTEARSLGVVDEENAARVLRGAIPELSRENSNSLIAITLEPKGGSPTGKATGPIVYTGKLIREE